MNSAEMLRASCKQHALAVFLSHLPANMADAFANDIARRIVDSSGLAEALDRFDRKELAAQVEMKSKMKATEIPF